MTLTLSNLCCVRQLPSVPVCLDCFCEHPLLYASPTTGGATGIGVRFGADLGSSSPRGSFDEGKTEDATPSVGQLSRHNLRVAAVRNCRELARYVLTNLESMLVTYDLLKVNTFMLFEHGTTYNTI